MEVKFVEFEEDERRKRRKREVEEEDDRCTEVVKPESVLPRMILTVLLVEADDSTRQIIAALLRKCSYRVCAVPDGLEAWEALKGSPNNIDLILTEVELPSISGFALLTLVMEDDICKNIPVIMMSSNDSISMVLKCMFKGAADFLIKPVRKNELKNLWQHVWRRQTLIGGQIPQKLTVPQNKVEATSENNASSHSSEYGASGKKNKECSEKGEDTQSSCTNPWLEEESPYVPNMQGLSQLKDRSASSLINLAIEKHELTGKLHREFDMLKRNTEETVTRHLVLGPEFDRDNADNTREIDSSNNEQDEPSTAIDFIGTFYNGPMHTYGVTGFNDAGTNKQFNPHLELSLRSVCSSSSNNQLSHSNASAFSWYNNCKTLLPFPHMLSIDHTESEADANESHNPLPNQLSGNSCCTSQRHGVIPGQDEQNSYAEPHMGWIPVLETCKQYGHSPSVFSTQTQPAQQQDQLHLPMTISTHSDRNIPNLEQVHNKFEDNSDESSEEGKILEPRQEVKNESSAHTRSASSSLCDGAPDLVNSNVYGSICSRDDGNDSSMGLEKKTANTEKVKDSKLIVQEGFKGMDPHRSSQREAALLKFRMKRKDRCYEKKVRYQSRQKLAEQRPRVKGQFVRRQQPSGADYPATAS